MKNLSVYELSWMIVSLTTSCFMGLAIFLILYRKIQENKVLWIGSILIPIAYSVDSVGVFILSNGTWMIDNLATNSWMREILINIKYVCELIGMIFLQYAAVRLLIINRKFQTARS